MAIHTSETFSNAIARLQARDPAALAHFIASLALHTGPIGEQAYTFILGNDLGETDTSIRGRICDLQGYEPHEYTHRHEFGAEVGQRLMLIVESIEVLVLPRDLRGAFELLVLAIRSEGHAMQTCGEHHEAVSRAIERASELIGVAARSLPRAETLPTLRHLVAENKYGGRRQLVDAVREITAIE